MKRIALAILILGFIASRAEADGGKKGGHFKKFFESFCGKGCSESTRLEIIKCWDPVGDLGDLPKLIKKC